MTPSSKWIWTASDSFKCISSKKRSPVTKSSWCINKAKFGKGGSCCVSILMVSDWPGGGDGDILLTLVFSFTDKLLILKESLTFSVGLSSEEYSRILLISCRGDTIGKFLVEDTLRSYISLYLFIINKFLK